MTSNTPSLRWLAIITLGCVIASCKPKKERADVGLTVVVCAPLSGTNTSSLSEEAKGIWQPLEAEGSCAKKILVPTGSLLRVDLNPFVEVKVDDQDDFYGTFQKKVSGQTAKMIRDNTERYLKSLDVSALNNASAKSDTTRLRLLLAHLQNSNGYDTMLVFSAQTGFKGAWNSIHVFNSLDSLAQGLSRIYCENSRKRVLLVYDPPIAQQKPQLVLDPVPPKPVVKVPPAEPTFYCGFNSDTALFFVIDNIYCKSKKAEYRTRLKSVNGGKARDFKVKSGEDDLVFFISVAQTPSLEEAQREVERYIKVKKLLDRKYRGGYQEKPSIGRFKNQQLHILNDEGEWEVARPRTYCSNKPSSDCTL